MSKIHPPKKPLQFLRWFCREDYLEEIEGDLTEVFRKQYESSPRKAKWKFVWSVIKYFRPEFMKSFKNHQPNAYGMYKSYLKIGWRNLLRNKGYSFINIGGLGVGIAVAILIGLWTHDELSFDKNFKSYDRLAVAMVNQPINDGIETFMALPMPVSPVLRDEYGHYFEHIAATWSADQTISFGDKMLTQFGCFTEPALPEMLTLDMIDGTRKALSDNNSILLSESLANSLFGELDPMGQIVSATGNIPLKVTGIFRDLPKNSSFSAIHFFAPINIILDNGIVNNNWLTSAFNIFVQLKPQSNFKDASRNISSIRNRNNTNVSRSDLFLNPMSRWHLYEFDNGVSVDGRIGLVRMIALIGLSVLLLACINFVNLSTAQSEKRMKEVGVRKSVGSVRTQLIFQFISETFLVVFIASIVSLVIAALLLPAFNELAEKTLAVPWESPAFLSLAATSVLLISFLAGCYPAFRLSAFQPAKVLKGSYRVGRVSALPRKVLVTVQLTTSVVLTIGAVIVYTQMNFAKGRPVGYERAGLLSIQPPFSFAIFPSYEAFRNETMASNRVLGISLSSSPTTNIFSSADNLDWPGKNPDFQTEFGTISVDSNFDGVVNWRVKEGRNFSDDRESDSLAFIFNETAIRRMGITDPIGKSVRWHGKTWSIIGVVEDMVMTSPFTPIQPTVFMMNNQERPFSVINLKVNTNADHTEVLSTIESIFKKFAPNTPFVYRFAEQEHALKFAEEERTGKLASVLASVAIMISCLGLIGLASFIAEQRTKEIGIRKVLGASVGNLWQMLSKDFMVLVVISCAIAIPMGYYFMNNWLQNYQYRTEISWWIFLITSVGALAITLLTVSFQAIKAALMNPVNSLKSE